MFFGACRWSNCGQSLHKRVARGQAFCPNGGIANPTSIIALHTLWSPPNSRVWVQLFMDWGCWCGDSFIVSPFNCMPFQWHQFNSEQCLRLCGHLTNDVNAWFWITYRQTQHISNIQQHNELCAFWLGDGTCATKRRPGQQRRRHWTAIICAGPTGHNCLHIYPMKMNRKIGRLQTEYCIILWMLKVSWHNTINYILPNN